MSRPLKEAGGDLEKKEACRGNSCLSLIFSHKFLYIAALLFSILIGLLCKSLTHNLNRPISHEAVPLWQISELHWAVRYLFGYLSGKLFPVGQLLKCTTTTVDLTNAQEVDEVKSCMSPVRAIIEKADAFVDLYALFDVQIIDIERSPHSLVRVTLLKKKTSSATTTTTTTTTTINNDNTAPLILYMHGGGFNVRGGKGALASQTFGYLLQLGEEDDDVNDSANSFVDDAVWAMLDYRLAPEYKYPSATEDCLLTLNHLVKELKFGRGGIHIAGVSAGATLAMEVTLKSMEMNIDSFYVDEPMVPLPAKDGNQRTTWSFDSESFRRYSYIRLPPVDWLEWSLKAMTGMETNHDVESNLAYGMIATDVDITGGSIDAAKWKHAFDESNSMQLPRLFLVTSNGDPLKSGGVYFKHIYEEVIEQVEAETPNNTKRQPQIKYIEASSGHTGFYTFEQPLFKDIMSEWYAEMKTAHRRKSNNGS